MINYADAPMTLSGNSDLYFNRSGITEVPAGFEARLSCGVFQNLITK